MSLPRFTLCRDVAQGDWTLVNQNGAVVRRWSCKADATAHGELETATGRRGIVRIENDLGGLEEHRTFPTSKP